MIRLTNILSTVRQVCWILLLVLYGAAALKVDSLHELFHTKELRELHSLEQENNPCHKSVYHHESQKGCEHKAHITENTKCPLCEFNGTPDQLVENGLEQLNAAVTDSNQIVWLIGYSTSTQLTNLSRGPPANV